jgi:hypothetical protein
LFFFCELHDVEPEWKSSSEEIPGTVPLHRTHEQDCPKGHTPDLEEYQKRSGLSESVLDPVDRTR